MSSPVTLKDQRLGALGALAGRAVRSLRGGSTLGDLRRREERVAWMLISPVVVGVVAFQVYPVLFSLFISLTRWNLLTPPEWIGFSNYVGLIGHDQTFRTALSNSTIYALGTVLPGIVLALVFASLLNLRISGRAVYRAIYFIPVVAPSVSAAILWTWIYQPDFGILNFALKQIGVHGPQWLGSPTWAMPAVMVMGIWQSLGYSIVILLAGLQNISRDYFEAASIDGANVFQRFVSITMPLLSPAIFFVLVLSIINAFQVFTSVFVMTGGGPANSTLTVVMYLYQAAFQHQDMGAAAAMAYCLFAVLAGLTALNFYLQRLWVFYDEK
jgi:multiple sugar transport system permease protein